MRPTPKMMNTSSLRKRPLFKRKKNSLRIRRILIKHITQVAMVKITNLIMPDYTNPSKVRLILTSSRVPTKKNSSAKIENKRKYTRKGH